MNGSSGKPSSTLVSLATKGGTWRGCSVARGGMEEERAERARIAEEKKARDDYNRLTFKEMIARARAEKAAKDLAEGRSASPAENGVTDNTAT